MTTVTLAEPADAMSAPEIDAVSWMALTKVVLLAYPFHCTLDPLTKRFEPYRIPSNELAQVFLKRVFVA